jgi:hypothetical protein
MVSEKCLSQAVVEYLRRLDKVSRQQVMKEFPNFLRKAELNQIKNFFTQENIVVRPFDSVENMLHRADIVFTYDNTLTIAEIKTNAERRMIDTIHRDLKPSRLELKGHSVESKWEFDLIRLAGYFLPTESREEWIGDLHEALQELRKEGVPRFIISTIAIVRLCLLAIALTRISIKDLIIPAKKRRM